MRELLADDIEILKIADHHFLHDLQQFWQRSTFFVVVQGALLTVFTAEEGGDGHRAPLSFGVAAFAIVFALFWGWISHLTASRIDVWRCEVKRLDALIDRHGVFARTESHATSWPQNPTKIAVILPFVVAVGWIALVLIDYS